jgi:nucleotide sugar dehydrogenase
MQIGIIGLGYVGNAINITLQSIINKNLIHTYDINGSGNSDSVDKLAKNSDIIFICVPTPMKSDGSCDTSIIMDVLSLLSKSPHNFDNKIIAIKSTLSIGSTNYFKNNFENLRIVSNPEFLREVSYVEDFANQNRIIIGGDLDDSKVLKEFYNKIFEDVSIFLTDSKTAETVKYVTNSFLSVKVAYANEIESLCSKKNIDYDEVIKLAILDKRLGHSHWAVPGPDGKKGFGGTCFPKDMLSLINQFDKDRIDSYILKAAWERNAKLDRPKEQLD